jgi:hypothetical protein
MSNPAPNMTTRYNWLPVTTSLLEILTAHGFKLISVFDGEAECKIGNGDTAIAQAADAADGVDEAWLLVSKPAEHFYRLLLVYGNDPDELVADYSYPNGSHDELEEALTAFQQAWSDKPCPQVIV